MFTDKSNKLNELIKAIAYKYDITAQEGYDIVRHQFEFVKNIMSNAIREEPSTHKIITIMNLGRFCIKSSIKRKFKNHG